MTTVAAPPGARQAALSGCSSEVPAGAAPKPYHDANGKFRPGHGGVPGGGMPHKVTERKLIAQKINARVDEILGGLFDIAFKGEDEAARVRAMQELLARYAGAHARGEVAHIPGLAEGKTLSEKFAAIVTAVAAGAISVEGGQKVADMLHKLATTSAVEELRERLDRLEGKRLTTITATVLSETPPVLPPPDDDGELV
jgi:hypothetical protein